MAKQLLQRALRKLDIPGEILSSDSMVELRGRSEIRVVRHNGILEYTDCRIQIAAKNGCVCICGADMRISLMNRERIVVFGRIDSVQYADGACK